MSFVYDVIVIGSGFGGSVSALRLAEKGYRVAVLEAGRRWPLDELPKRSWDARKMIWAPWLGLTGIERFSILDNCVVLSAAGVGGGSLIYGNVLYEPRDRRFFNDRSWAQITDWQSELTPFYNQAKSMLGVATNPFVAPGDDVLREVARDMGVEDTFRPTDVGVFFGEPGMKVSDPYFGGLGPARVGCLNCGVASPAARMAPRTHSR